MQRALSFDQTPSLTVPLRFLMTAPAFALLAALLLLWQGEAALASRWAPGTLALTHLLTLGFLTMCMVGVLLQILPVVLGIGILHADRMSSAVHVLLTAGTAMLSTGFVSAFPILFQFALPPLLAAFGLLLIVGLRGVWRGAAKGALNKRPGGGMPVLNAIRFALLALVVTLALGTSAATVLGWNLDLPLILLTDLHATWGLLGWVFLLTAGVAYQVVPMFLSTKPFPPLFTRWLAGTLLVLLLVWSVASSVAGTVHGNLMQTLPALGIAVLVAAFSLYTLWQVARKKRAQTEAPVRFWLAALCSLAASALLWIVQRLWPASLAGFEPTLLLGVLFIAGFAVSVVNGMLYKIVPFLAWYHLQHGGVKAPNVRRFLPDSRATLQFKLHLGSLALLLAATLWPAWLARPAALVFGVSMLMLWINLWRTLALYRETASSASVATATTTPRHARMA
jgi:hypothetical protein